jgi:CRISPR-associated protein Csm2
MLNYQKNNNVRETGGNTGSVAATPDTDYVKRAERIMKEIKNADRGRIRMTTSKIRKFLSLANAINNKITGLEANGEIKDDTLPQSIINDCLALKVQLIYQCGRDGRDKTVTNFVNKTGLIQEIDKIKDSANNFKKFFSYLEALVAFHKFEGGRD